MKQLLYKLINKFGFIQKLYIHMFNKIKMNNFKYPGIFFRYNKINVSSSNEVAFGENSEIYNLHLNCNGNKNHIKFGNNLKINGSNTVININGSQNSIIVEDENILQDVNFFISGNNNTIFISKDCSIVKAEFHIEQDNNSIFIGKGTTMHGREYKHIHFALDEATTIRVDEDCMISNNVQFRSSDSHSILNLQGYRINQAKDIAIGKHCWIGLNTLILKGVSIPDNCVIAAGSLCTKEFLESNVIIGGNPAKVIKREVNWDRKFL